MTYEEAVKIVSTLELENSKKLCPLLAGNCSDKCVCYLPAQIIDDASQECITELTLEEKSLVTSWDVIDPYCRCYFLFGRRL